MKDKLFKLFFFIVFSSIIQAAYAQGEKDRQYWIKTMTKIVDPVLNNLSENKLKQNMPIEITDSTYFNLRKEVGNLEAFGRVFAGISPWLSLGADLSKEGKLRAKYIDLCVKCITNAVNPESPDYVRFDSPEAPPLVNAAHFAHGLLRSKGVVWNKLSPITQQRVIEQLKASRKIKPNESNWLLFSAMVEATLLQLTGECDMRPIEYAIQKHKEWYKGDAWYGDGEYFHLDYYNGYVIQPMLMDVVRILKEHNLSGEEFYDAQLTRFMRFAEQQERLISPEGTYPPLGRSLVYRFGAFQALAQVALMKQLPEYISPAQVRCALTKVIKRQLLNEGFDKQGWLRLGFCGHQPEIADYYSSTASLYLCTVVFLPLGLDEKDDFWTGAPQRWTSLKAWSGEKIKRDKAIKN